MKKLLGTTILISGLSFAVSQQSMAVTEGHNASIGIVEAITVTETQALNFGSFIKFTGALYPDYIVLSSSEDHSFPPVPFSVVDSPSLGTTTVTATANSSINIKVDNIAVGGSNPTPTWDPAFLHTFTFREDGGSDADCSGGTGCTKTIPVGGTAIYDVGATLGNINDTYAVGTHAFTYDVNVTYN